MSPCSSAPQATESVSRFTEQPDLQHSKTLRTAGVWTGAQQTRLNVRHFEFTADEPHKVGGRDQGPTPMEYLAGAVNSCITVVIDQLAARQQLTLEDVQTYTLASQDTRGLAGTADVQPYAHAYRLQIVITTPERDEHTLRQFAARAEHICPAINLLRDANTGLEVSWSFTEQPHAGAAERLSNAALGYTEANDAPEPFLTVTNADLAPSVPA
jgi:uncharacterized OsmC-like protein